ncbi:MAG: tetratricopeptide repeat protein [Cyanobacteria bacterium]|nr:tetratricopeptide repeat protein [Cyanobacteriota bacterium]
MTSYDYLSLGESFEERGKYQKAERLYLKALKLKSKEVGDHSEELIPYLYNLGMVLAALDKAHESIHILGRLITILIKEHGEDHGDVRELREVIYDLRAEMSNQVVYA